MTATASATSTTAPTSTGASGRTRVWPWFLLAAALVAVVLLAGAPNQKGRTYDPNSNDQYGTKALVQLLKDFGADVDITERQPPADADVAIFFPGDVPDDREAGLRRWAAQGHTLVIADPRSELNPFGAERERYLGTFTDLTVGRGDCTIDALRDARSITLGEDADTVVAARRLPVPAGAQQCFNQSAGNGDDTGRAALVVAVPEGRGHLVSVGAPSIFVNTLLAEGDNSVVAVNLLAPRPGTKVAILQRPPGSEVDPSLSSLLPTGIKVALLQLVVAFLVYAFFRGRRLGKPVVETQPVQIPGSELVSAVGNLLQQTKSPDRAAVLLRADLRRRLCERLGLPADVPPEVIAVSVEARTGIDRELSMPILADLPCPNEAALVDLAAGVDDLRRQVLGGA